MSRQWTLTIDAPTRWLNANDRRYRISVAHDVRAWRTAAGWRARAAGLPRNLAKVRILAELRFPNWRKRDEHNYYPTLKAVVDGLVDHGLIPDDNSAHLIGPDIRMGDPLPPPRPGRGQTPGQVVLTITEEA